jgi:hypothetical protein
VEIPLQLRLLLLAAGQPGAKVGLYRVHVGIGTWFEGIMSPYK